MNRRRLTFGLLLLLIMAVVAPLNFSVIFNMKRHKESPRTVSRTNEPSLISASNSQPQPGQPSAAPSPVAPSCVRPEDKTEGLESAFKRDPAFWGRRPKLVRALKDYAALHKRALASGEGRFVLSHSWGGMNNRFLPLASALLFGMMTGRAVLSDMEGVLTYSKTASSAPLFQNPGFSWELRDNPKLYKLYGVENRDVQHFRLMDPNGAHLKPFPFQQLACEHYSEVFQRQIVDIQANFWYGRLIMLNPHYAERVRQIFSADGDPHDTEPVVYGALLRVLFEPNAQVLREKCDIQMKQFGSETGGSGAPPLQCHALQVRLMAVGVMLDKDFGAKSVTCAAERMRTNSTRTPTEYSSERRVFVAIDRAVGLQDTVAALKEQGLEAKLQGNADELEARSNEKQFRSGYLDMLLMADCGGSLFVSQHSTFGYTIAAMSKSRSVVHRQGIPATGSNCYGLSHREPVFHGWSTLDEQKVTCMTDDLRRLVNIDKSMD